MTTTIEDLSAERLGRMSADELEQAGRVLTARLHDLHSDGRGEPRELDGDGEEQAARVLRLLNKVEAHQAIRAQFDRGAGYETAFPPRGVSAREHDRLRSRALRILERRGRDLPAAAGDRVDALVRTRLSEENRSFDGSVLAERIVLTEQDDYQRAFAQILQAGLRGRQAVLSAEEAGAVRAFEAFEARAMSGGVDAAGGFGVPVFIDPTIILTGQQGGEFADILQVARVVPVTTDAWKGVSSAGMSWEFQAEAAEVTDSSPTLAQPSIPIHMARGFVPYSIEVGMDYPAFAEEMRVLLSEGYLDLAGRKATAGSGSGEPRGIVTALDANTNVEVTVTTAGTVGAVDVYAQWAALPKRARRRATWMSATTVQNEVRQLGANANGSQDPNFTIDLTQEMVTRLFGKRYLLNDEMDDHAAGTGSQNWLIVGDWSRFVVPQRVGMTVEPVPHLFGVTNNRPTGQRGLFAYARLGSDSVDDLAFRLLKNNAS